MIFDAALDLRRWQKWLYVAWFSFVVTYRKTTLGPFWLLIGPALFILIVGGLYSKVLEEEKAVYIPHLAIGLILWTILGGIVTRSPRFYNRNSAQILQGSMSIVDISIVEVFTILLQFFHQAIIIIIILLFYNKNISWYSLVSVLGLAIIIANAFWISIVFGIIGSRYKDFSEIVVAIMRVAFLASPILWMASSARGQMLGAYLLFNPFYHFLEIVRAPLLGLPISKTTWLVVLAVTVGGFVLANAMHKRYARLVPLWV